MSVTEPSYPVVIPAALAILRNPAAFHTVPVASMPVVMAIIGMF